MAIKRIKSYSLEGIPESIKAMRSEAGMSQALLAERIGLSSSVVSRYETGTRRIGMDTYMKIVQACGHQIQII